MFNVVIVDDENFIIKSLVSSIEWASLNLQVTATFSTSIDALTFIENNPVHIVITDIRMPGISGLDLCSHIHTHYPHIQTIVMSGYADFVYAQKAISCNVLGYCVKPLDFNELTLLLRKAISHFSQPSPLLYDMIDAIESEDHPLVASYLAKHHIDPKNFYLVVSIGAHNLSSHLSNCRLSLRFGIHKYIYFLETPYNNDLTLTTLSALTIKGIGIHPLSLNVHLLKQAVYDAITMSHQYFFVGSPSLCNQLPTCTYHKQLCQLQTHLTSHNLGSIQLIMADLLDEVTLKNYDINFALKVCNLFITHYMTHYQLDIEDLYVYSIDDLPVRFSDFSQMLYELFDMICSNISAEELPNSYNNNFINVLHFINHNYTKDISIKDIALHLNLNPNYISQLFKKETGSTYIKYLTQLRIDKAKELLHTTDLSLSDICDQIGYNDYFYFLKIFKKCEGISPSKYRLELT